MGARIAGRWEAGALCELYAVNVRMSIARIFSLAGLNECCLHVSCNPYIFIIYRKKLTAHTCTAVKGGAEQMEGMKSRSEKSTNKRNYLKLTLFIPCRLPQRARPPAHPHRTHSVYDFPFVIWIQFHLSCVCVHTFAIAIRHKQSISGSILAFSLFSFFREVFTRIDLLFFLRLSYFATARCVLCTHKNTNAMYVY